MSFLSGLVFAAGSVSTYVHKHVHTVSEYVKLSMMWTYAARNLEGMWVKGTPCPSEGK